MIKDNSRFQQQLAFVRELDKLKTVFRQTYLLDASRKENDAEHSWQIALMAVLFEEYADERNLDMLAVVKMLLLHDVIEVHAGDTYIYDEESKKTQSLRERRAATKVFGALPGEQEREFRALWEDFETGVSGEARFARAIDRFQPLLHNYLTDGKAWKEHGVKAGSVRNINEKIKDGSLALWEYAEGLIAGAVAGGYLEE